jgi:phytoene dehydrogenase-like protein
MKKKYDHIVVGSGISGLTLASLLVSNGQKVLLIEKAPQIGGSLIRFYKEGIPFDTGFHFTGGFAPGGLLADMLQALGIQDSIKPIFLTAPGSGVYVFEQNGAVYDMPSGTDNFRLALHRYFPEESSGIDGYFALLNKVRQATVTFDLRKISVSAATIDEDYISLEQVLNQFIKDPDLKGILSTYCLCYGASPREVSFANHARVAAGLYESVARIERGGEAFIQAFRERFAQSDIEILCNTSIVECADVKNSCVGEFVLSNGQIVYSTDCTFTIHPKEILKILPRQHLKKAFVDRISAYETSHGFFSVFGVVNNADCSKFGPSIVSLLPSTDLDVLFEPSTQERDGALAVILSVETIRGNKYCVVNAFEPDSYSNVQQWADSSVGKRPAAYYEYKARKIESITRRFCNYFPHYRDDFKVLDAASSLTFRDYLFSPEGNAYGIKQKMGQYNLFGKLPLVNLYAAGQSAVLPGIVGAMLSSFIVARNILGKEKLSSFIEGRLSS